MQRLLVIVLLFAPTLALADQLSKEACIDAHSRGQDAKEVGKLTLARKLFLSCAQSGCPNAVQGDCARFADDLSALQPTVNFAARDAGGNDLPNTTVWVDGVLVATVIDGKPVEIDPGTRHVRFSNAGRDQVVTVVIASGEKGRVVQARFGGGAGATAAASVTSTRSTTKTTHPKGALVLAITGAVVAVGGGALAFYGMSQIPDACSLTTSECAAPPNDPVFEEAASGARTVNLGIAAAGIGFTALASGVVWYIAGAKTVREVPLQAWLGRDGGGFAVRAEF